MHMHMLNCSSIIMGNNTLKPLPECGGIVFSWVLWLYTSAFLVTYLLLPKEQRHSFHCKKMINRSMQLASKIGLGVLDSVAELDS